MSGGELLAELVRAHFEEEPRRFGSILNQVIAAEARAGHTQVARRLRELRDETREHAAIPRAIPLARASRDLTEFIDVAYSDVRIADLVLPEELRSKVERVVVEQRSREALERHGLTPRRRLLLHGPPGSGKTMSAQAIAGELQLPIARVRLEVLFSRYMGETAGTLTDIFAEATRLRAVYLFDEFDALGSQRSGGADVGEMRRVVGTFLQLLDADKSSSLFIAASNVPQAIDNALIRRFDDVLQFLPPSNASRVDLLKRLTRESKLQVSDIEDLVQNSSLSMADLAASVADARKAAIIEERSPASLQDLRQALADRVRITT